MGAAPPVVYTGKTVDGHIIMAMVHINVLTFKIFTFILQIRSFLIRA